MSPSCCCVGFGFSIDFWFGFRFCFFLLSDIDGFSFCFSCGFSCLFFGGYLLMAFLMVFGWLSFDFLMVSFLIFPLNVLARLGISPQRSSEDTPFLPRRACQLAKPQSSQSRWLWVEGPSPPPKRTTRNMVPFYQQAV